MNEPRELAVGEDDVWRYLRELAMPEPDIRVYLDEARQGPGPATFSFGTDDEGLIPQLSLTWTGSDFVLAGQGPPG